MKNKLKLMFIIITFIVSQNLFAQDKYDFEETFDVKAGQKLDVKIKTGGDIQITGWDKNVVEAKIKLKGRDADEVEVSFNQNGGVVEILIERKHKNGNHNSNAKVNVNVPHNFMSIFSRWVGM